MAVKKKQAEPAEAEKAAESDENTETAIKEPALFHKDQLMGAKRYHEDRDLVGALLADGEKYSLEAVDKKIEEYKKGKVE